MTTAGPAPAAPGVVVRSLVSADLEHVLHIERQAFTTPWRRSTFEGLLQRTDADLFAAHRAGRLLGYAVCWTVLDQAELGNLAVDSAARGAGVGHRLVAAVLERVQQRGAQECFLEVRESNHRALGLYRACGFQLVGRRRAYYTRPVEDALVMRWTGS